MLLAGDAAHISTPAGGQGMNSGMQDAQNLAWKLAFALKGGNTEQLLDSYDRERRPAIASFVLPFTTYSARIVFTAARLRLVPIALWAGRLALRNRQIRHAAGRGFAMLGTRYKPSPLTSGERKWIGRRVAGGPMSGLTIFSFSASAQILQGLEQAVRDFARDGRLPVIASRNLESADPIGIQWQARSNLVAFVRPDGYVGWAALSPTATETVVGVRKALGMFIDGQPVRPQSVPSKR